MAKPHLLKRAPKSLPPASDFLTHRLKAEHSLGSLLYRVGLFGHLHRSSQLSQNVSYLGRHVLIEASWPIAHCSTAHLLKHLTQAVDTAGVTRLKEYAQHFPDQSFIAAVVIQESHIILHGHPDGRLVIDAYTCGEADPQQIILALCKRLPICIHHGEVLTRGLYEATPGKSWCADANAMRLGLKNDIPLHAELQLTPAEPCETIGWHGIVELYGCSSVTVNDAAGMTEIFHDIAAQLNIDVLKTYHHEFSPQGLSIACIAKGFHMTMHSWPENYYAPIDIYCSQPYDVYPLFSALERALGAQGMAYTTKNRGYIHASNRLSHTL